MEAEKEKVCEGAEYAFITDIRIALECLHEACRLYLSPNQHGS